MSKGNTYFIEFLVAVIALMAAIVIGVILYYRNKQDKLLKRLQEMIDSAIDGSFERKSLDETRFSSVETSMWRFLKDSRLSSLYLTEQKKKIQTLISDISHQTVTPIANIRLYSELLLENQREIEEQAAKDDDDLFQGNKEEIAAINEQAEKLEFLIQSLVKLSRLENGIISVMVKEDNIQNVLSAVSSQMNIKANQKGIELKVPAVEELAIFDAKWTIEAIINIVDNAIKYTPCGGKVSVNIEVYQLFLRINIEDNGIGIPEEEQSKIFTRFYRSEEVSDVQGVGVGLYLAREVISAQKGYIKVKSEIGKGSVFSVFLPRE